MGCGSFSRATGGDGRVHPEAAGTTMASELATVLPVDPALDAGQGAAKPSQSPVVQEPAVPTTVGRVAEAAGAGEKAEGACVRTAAAEGLQTFFEREGGQDNVHARYAAPAATMLDKGPASEPPPLLEQVERATGSGGARYVDAVLLGSRAVEEWTEALAPLVDWIVAAAAAAPHDDPSKRRLRALLAQRVFTTNLTRSNFEDLHNKLRAQMLAQGNTLKALPPDAEGLDLGFHLQELVSPGRPSRATQANEGVLPVPPSVDWNDPIAMNERAYIHMLKLVAIAIDAGFQAKVAHAMRRTFGESFAGHTPAPPKTFARMLGKLSSVEDHRGETQRPRPMFNVDVVRAAVAVQTIPDLQAALAVLAQEFGGFVKEKNKYAYSPEDLESEFYLRLVLVSMVHEDGRTFGELAEDPAVRSQWEAYAASGQAYLDGAPESRRAAHVQRALTWLQAPELAGERVRMICEVQVMTEATAHVRHGMHELFKVFRAPDSISLFRDLDKTRPVEPQDLWLAARAGELYKVDEFLSREPGHLNEPNSVGTTALYDAAERGHAEVVSRLLEAAADANKASEGGTLYTPLHIAAQDGHKEVVDVLLRAGADASRPDGRGALALHVAAESGYPDIAQALLGVGVGVDAAEGDKGSTALLLAVENGHHAVVEELLRAGASVDALNSEGETPLALAIYYGHVAIARLLVEHGADLSQRGQYGTPLDEAMMQGRAEIAELIRARLSQ
mmetsp:Transcript_4951/g.14449  ORF Transcript_4951/g.14449 Transcript_4951/m.14449 type:complete len:731 (-) Transcript_4951:2-2194(-)